MSLLTSFASVSMPIAAPGGVPLLVPVAQPSLWEDVCSEGIKGAKWGTMVGLGAVSMIATTALSISAAEGINRLLGNEPKWVIDHEQDCMLEQFQNLPACTEEPVFSSIMSFSFTIAATGTAVGTIGGVIAGIVKHYF